MNKAYVEKIADLIVAGAQPVVMPPGVAGGFPTIKLSDHYPRLVREALRSFCIAFAEEAATRVAKAATATEAAEFVRTTLTWE